MKRKVDSRKNFPVDKDRFDKKSSRVSSAKKDKTSKKRLSIYDEFDDDLSGLDLDSESPLFDNPYED